jgi:iron complex outermembrane receptor protein
MNRHREIQRVIAWTLALGAISATGSVVLAQEQAPATEQPALQTVVVTGSFIKRTDFATPSPVQVVTADDLQQSGYTSVSDVLRNLAANGQGTLSQSFNGAFAGGASGVALRGLTVGNTLTLIDSERMIAYPLSDDGERSFVDISQIPMDAVERIDVLKDGASAEYGSDAIAGVVNVILKRNYTGASITADVGTSQHRDGTTERLAGIWGAGDLAADGYNAYLAAEYRHQDEILAINRQGDGDWARLNWTPLGGTNGLLGAGSGFNSTGAGSPFPNTNGYYLVPAGAASYQNALDFSKNCPSVAAITADQCAYFPPRSQVQPQTGNLDILARFTKNMGGDWQAIITGSLFRSEAEQVNNYQVASPPGGPSTPFQFPAYGPGFAMATTPVTLTVPPTNPMNTSGQTLYPAGALTEFGQSVTQFVTNTYRVFADFKGTAWGWDTDSNFGYMYAKTTQKFEGLVNYGALETALQNGYILGSDNPAVSAQVSPTFDSEMSNTLEVVDLRASRELTQLPGGPLSLAIGAGYQHRYLNATQSPAAESGDYQLINAAFAQGGQTNWSGYAEFVAPVVKMLEVDAAVRYDHYNGAAGGATTPKFGVKFTPFEQVTLRGTYGKGFRAPNPAENGNAGAAFLLGSFSDLSLCPSAAALPAQLPQFGLGSVQPNPAKGDVSSFCNFTPVFLQGTNPNLLPEKSTNWTAGIIITPVRDLSLSVDYWDIKIDRDIISSGEVGVLPSPPAPINNVRTGPVSLPVVGGGSQLFPQGVPIYSAVEYYNASNTHVNGVDVDFLWHFDIGKAGRINASVNYTHLITWDFASCDNAGNCQTVHLAGTHGPTAISGDTGNPKDRGVASLGWDYGGLNLTASVNYVGSFSLLDPSQNINSCEAAILGSFNVGTKFLNGFVPTQYCSIKSFTTLDLYSNYAFNKNFSIHGSILNAFDTQPPVDLQTYGGGGGLNYDPAMHQAGAVGRFYSVGATFTW